MKHWVGYGCVARNFSCAVAALIGVTLAAPAGAQTRPTGYVSTFVDIFPSQIDAVELRARLFAEDKLTPSPRITINLAGFVEGLVARRHQRAVRDAVVDAQDASVTFTAGPIDVLAGYTRVAWGRLDELQPTDVINPLDVSRFFFEGRSEARLPVALVRARYFVSDAITLEGVYVPIFRRGRFDRLAEPTSPFRPIGASGSTIDEEPERSLGNAQGGVRLSATTGRVDWSVSAFSGFEPFGAYTVGSLVPAVSPPPGPLPPVTRRFPRFTMIGGDFETVRGVWGLRGEVALFVDDTFQAPAFTLSGSSLEAGIGADRKAGDYRVSGTVLFHHESYNVPLLPGAGVEPSRTDVSFIASLDRTFAREKYAVRVFSVYNPSEGSSFIRGLTTAKLTDDVAIEGSLGLFPGDGRDVIGRFGNSDFAYGRLKFYF